MRTVSEYKYTSRRINLVLGFILIWNVYYPWKSYFYQLILSLAHTYIHRQNKNAPKFLWKEKFFFFKLKISLPLKGSIHSLKDIFQEMNSFFNNILIFCKPSRNFISYLIRAQISTELVHFFFISLFIVIFSRFFVFCIIYIRRHFN